MLDRKPDDRQPIEEWYEAFAVPTSAGAEPDARFRMRATTARGYAIIGRQLSAFHPQVAVRGAKWDMALVLAARERRFESELAC